MKKENLMGEKNFQSMIIGKRIRDSRRLNKLNQTELAIQANKYASELGVRLSQRIISNYELGITVIPAHILPPIVRVLNISYEYLVEGKSEIADHQIEDDGKRVSFLNIYNQSK